MNGTDASTGKSLSGIAHLRQSIRDILTTPIGTRRMRLEYGSDLFKLVDAPMNSGTLMKIYAATIAALQKWEPRLKVSSVKASSASPGHIVLDIVGTYLPDGKEVTLEGIVVS